MDEQTNQLKKISKELKQQRQDSEETNTNIKTLTDIAVSDEKLEFQDEQKFDLQMNIMKDQNNLLSAILDKIELGTSDKKDEKKKGLFGSLFAGLKKFLPLGFLGLFKPIFKKLFSPKGMLGLGKKLLKIVGAPILGVIAGFDFFKGFENAEEITGRTGLGAKFQAGLYQVLSGLTFGLIDPKKISETFDKVNDFLFDNVTIPLMDFILDFPNRISGLFDSAFASLKEVAIDFANMPIIADVLDKIKTGFGIVKTNLTERFIDPIKGFISGSVEFFNDILAKIQNFGAKIQEIAMRPLNATKDFFENTKKRYDDFKENFSFGNMFESDAEEKLRKDVEQKSVQTFNTTEQKTEATTNNNVLTSNNKTVVNNGSDMSTRSDDLINQSPIFGF